MAVISAMGEPKSEDSYNGSPCPRCFCAALNCGISERAQFCTFRERRKQGKPGRSPHPLPPSYAAISAQPALGAVFACRQQLQLLDEEVGVPGTRGGGRPARVPTGPSSSGRGGDLPHTGASKQRGASLGEFFDGVDELVEIGGVEGDR